MSIERIGMVSRTPVIELEGMGEIARVGQDFAQATWPHPLEEPMLVSTFQP